jgi:hypothetical protein
MCIVYYNWFCIDHVGFNEVNPRKRDIGHHKIYDHYHSYIQRKKLTNHLIQWHYHPPAVINDAHRSGISLNSSNIYDILSRKVIDRLWFPCVFRPGFHTERPDINWFLEQWIPFDYANQSVKGKDTDQPDIDKGRYGDWRRAPTNWIPYNPDIYDYQKKGNCRRYIARCLNMNARLRQMTKKDVQDAFDEAKTTGVSLLSFTNHDFRDMEHEIIDTYKMIDEVSKKTEIRFQFVDAITGMRKVLGLKKEEEQNLDIELKKNENQVILNIRSKGDLFGLQPYLALKTIDNKYHWENLDFQDKNHWSYTFDYANVELEKIRKIGIASNTPSGITEVVVIDPKTGKQTRKVWNNG